MKKQIVVAALTLLASAPLCFGQTAQDKSPPPPPTQEEEERFRQQLILPPESVGTSLPPILRGALQPVDLPPGKDSWAVQLVTRGGFLGGGKGDVTITSGGSLSCSATTNPCADKPPPAALQSLAKRIMAAKPTAWEGSAISTCRDCFVMMLTLHRRERDGRAKTYTAYWDDATRERMPVEVLRIYGAVSALAGLDK